MKAIDRPGTEDEGARRGLADALLDAVVRRTAGPRVLGRIGAVARGSFEVQYPPGILRQATRSPVLVATVEDAGGRRELAERLGAFAGLGADLVVQCTNELAAAGADPYFFVHDVALGGGAPQALAELAEGIARELKACGCSWLGGRAREGAGSSGGAAVGFALGGVERSRLLKGVSAQPQDVIIAIDSAGLGLRDDPETIERILRKRSLLATELEGLGRLDELLLRPGRGCARPILSALRFYRVKKVLRGVHRVGNEGFLPAMRSLLFPSLDAVLDDDTLPGQGAYHLLARKLGLDRHKALQAFNWGVEVLLVVAPHYADAVVGRLRRARCPARRLGALRVGTARIWIAGASRPLDE